MKDEALEEGDYLVRENWNMKTTLSKAHAAGAAMMKVDASSGKLPNIKKL